MVHDSVIAVYLIETIVDPRTRKTYQGRFAL